MGSPKNCAGFAWTWFVTTIAKLAHGSMRDAQSLLDLAISSYSDKATLSDLGFLSDAASFDDVFKLADAIAGYKLDDVVSVILQSDAKWKWDDDNQTDHPIGTINLVNGQQDYELAGGTYLKVNRVEVKDVNGNYELIHPIDEKPG